MAELPFSCGSPGEIPPRGCAAIPANTIPSTRFRSLGPRAISGWQNSTSMATLRAADDGPHGVLRLLEAELPGVAALHEQLFQALLEEAVVLVHVHGGRALGRPVVEGIEDANHGDVFLEEAEGVVAEPFDAPPRRSARFLVPLQDLAEFQNDLVHELLEEPLLVLEVVVEDGLGYPRGLHDLPHGGGGVALPVEGVDGGAEEPLADRGIGLWGGCLLGHFFIMRTAKGAAPIPTYR